METDQHSHETEFKIEIDVAEEPPLAWSMTQQQSQSVERSQARQTVSGCDRMEEEERTVKIEVETERDTQEPLLGRQSVPQCMTQQHSREPEIKIEIDVAEEPPLAWCMTQQHSHAPAGKDFKTDKTVNLQMERTSEIPTSSSADSNVVWLKQEAAEKTSSSADSNIVWLKQEAAEITTSSSADSDVVWLKQEAPEIPTSSSAYRDVVWLKQEVAEIPTLSSAHSDVVRLKQEAAEIPTSSSAYSEVVRQKQGAAKIPIDFGTIADTASFSEQDWGTCSNDIKREKDDVGEGGARPVMEVSDKCKEECTCNARQDFKTEALPAVTETSSSAAEDIPATSVYAHGESFVCGGVEVEEDRKPDIARDCVTQAACCPLSVGCYCQVEVKQEPVEPTQHVESVEHSDLKSSDTFTCETARVKAVVLEKCSATESVVTASKTKTSLDKGTSHRTKEKRTKIRTPIFQTWDSSVKLRNSVNF
ncbi:mucin-22-like [Littorina saxatilis]|uniref:mucin-22-like n=1 Tax=Littorina saxatilis TaxID=31220 RepID=UPI0038B5E84B